MLAAPTTYSIASLSFGVTIDETKEPFPIRANSIASSIVLYGITVETGPNASMLCTSVLLKGSLFLKRIGEKNAPTFLSAPNTSKSSKLP